MYIVAVTKRLCFHEKVLWKGIPQYERKDQNKAYHTRNLVWEELLVLIVYKIPLDFPIGSALRWRRASDESGSLQNFTKEAYQLRRNPQETQRQKKRRKERRKQREEETRRQKRKSRGKETLCSLHPHPYSHFFFPIFIPSFPSLRVDLFISSLHRHSFICVLDCHLLSSFHSFLFLSIAY